MAVGRMGSWVDEKHRYLFNRSPIYSHVHSVPGTSVSEISQSLCKVRTF